ncbi:MAG: hypothetical protein OXT07_07910 [bacterium]|nr:hypothetical protein [bacterium]
MAVFSLCVTTVGAAATVPVAAEVEARDRLIAAQEALLNVYRCMFSVDVAAVPGGCKNGQPARPLAEPAPSPPNPAQSDIDVRDALIEAQEALLNTYRCRFSVDTEIVPGGCPHTGVSQAAPNAGPDPESPQVSSTNIPAQARNLSVQLSDLVYNTADDMVLQSFFDIYGCLSGGAECSWTMEAHIHASIIENMTDVYGRSYGRDILLPIIQQMADILRTLYTLIDTFSAIANGYNTPDATTFAQLKSQSSGLLNSLSGDIFSQIEDAVDQVEILEVPENALFLIRQAVDNARVKISEVLQLLNS